jgi:hypothetical protein
MTIFTGTKEELSLWIAQRDILADQQIAQGRYKPASEYQPKSSRIQA